LDSVLLTGPNVILALKIAVSAVTVLLLISLIALLLGKYQLHGRINIAFAILTTVALLALELAVRVIDPRLFDYLGEEARRALAIHLCFSLPAAALMPIMLVTGFMHRRSLHLKLAVLFGVLWTGTLVTGLLYLPHAP
jgi:uncharacterized membrane protein YozB (DUF420 family)